MINYVKKFFIITISILIVFKIFLFFTDSCSMDNLPEGDLKNTYHSNNGKYTLNSYLYSPGALVNFSHRVEVINNETKEKRNIYWNFDESEGNIEWLDDENVIINGKKINLIDGWYNCECIINNGVSK